MFWKKRFVFDDEKKNQFVETISLALLAQTEVAGDHSIDDGKGHLNRRALGYIYGFIDAALRTVGQEMADMSIGPPITYQVLRHLFPGREERYLTFLVDHLQDPILMVGMMKGGQQYLDYRKPGTKGVPMGLARYMLEGDGA